MIQELGPDSMAVRPEDRDSILFDLGLGALQVDVCVRASEPELLSALRAGAGRSIFDIGNPATAAIFEASPHRVFVTRIGRAEVYQPIPTVGGKSPDGLTSTCRPSFFAVGPRIQRRFQFPEIGYPAFISTRRIRKRMAWGQPNLSTAPNSTHSRKPLRGSATGSSWS
jgi:hypothetical protein